MQNGSKVKLKDTIAHRLLFREFHIRGYIIPEFGKIYTVKEYSCFKCSHCPNVHTRVILEELETGAVKNNGGGLHPDVYEEVTFDVQAVDSLINNTLAAVNM